MQLLQTRRPRPRTTLPTRLLVLLTALAASALPATQSAAAQVQRVESWGANDFGQLGDGTTSALDTPDHLTPGTVRELSGVTAVAAGCSHSLALLSNGTVKAWGNNYSGQLGDGTTGSISNSTPVTVVDPSNPSAPLSGVTAIAAGCDHSLALLSNGTVKAWGANDLGQLGNGSTGGMSGTPVTVVAPGNPSAPLGGVRELDGGISHSLALLSNGTVRAWGSNSVGQLGNGSTGGASGTPVTVANVTGARDISAGDNHSLVLLSSLILPSTVRAWGSNSVGQLGNGSTGGTSGTPVTVVNLTGAQDIAAGGDHSLAYLSAGTLRSWGGNNAGQLGNGSTTNSGTPVTVRTGIGTITHIAAGGDFSLAA